MVVLDRFSGGSDPEGWILRAEQYFIYLGFSEQHWLPLPSFYLDGEALTWFTWLFRNKQFYNWKHFTEKLLMGFPQQTFIDSAGMADTSRACVDYGRYTTPTFAQRSEKVYPSTFSSLSKLQTPEIDEPTDGLIEGHKYATIVDKVFNANTQNSAELSNTTEVKSVLEDGNAEADHMFDEMPNGVLEANSSVTPVSPNADGTNSEDIVDDMVNEDNSHNNDSALHSHYETLQTKVTVVTSDITIGISSHSVPLTSLVVSTGYNLIVTGSKHEDEENTGNNVARVVGISPLRDDYLVAFASQGYFMLNVFWKLVKIEFSYDGAFWLHVFPYLHISLDEFCLDNQHRVLLYLDFQLHKCNWVDTGQAHILLRFLLSSLCAYKNCNSLASFLGGVILLSRIMRSRTISVRALQHSTTVVQSEEADSGELIGKEFPVSLKGENIVADLYLDKFFSGNWIFIPTSDMHSIEVLLTAEHETPTGGCDRLNLSQFSFDPGAQFFTILIRLTPMDLCVWDSRIRFTFLALTGYTIHMEALQLQVCSGKFCSIAYSNSMTRVWDPGQSWYANPSILQSDLTLAVAFSPNFTHFYIVERDLAFYMTTLTSMVSGLTWRRNILVFLLAWHAESKALYVDMRTLEMCLLKVNVFASLGTFLLWKDNSGLAHVAKYRCYFRSASIMLILTYFHRCKSKGVDTKMIFTAFQMFMISFICGALPGIDDYFCAIGATKPLVSSISLLVSALLIFIVGLGGRYCIVYSIKAAVFLNIEFRIFDIGEGNDMSARKSMEDRMIVPCITFWIVRTDSLSVPWYTNLLPFPEDTLSAILAFSTALSICYLVLNLHRSFVVLNSVEKWDQPFINDHQPMLWLGKQKGVFVLHLSYRIVITLLLNGIETEKHVSLYESDSLSSLPLLYFNLEDKVHIPEGSIVMNGPGPIWAKQPNTELRDYVWDPG